MSAQISIDEALTGTDQIRQVRASASGVHWLASIATEDNRTTIRRFHAGGTTDLTPEANVRSRVMEYGGGAYDVAEDLVVWVDDTTKRLWLLEGEARRPLTPSQERFRFGGLHLAPHRRIVVAVREDHAAAPEPRTEIVALDLDGDNEDGGRVLVTGADFYAGPVVKGHRLAWFQWMHPNMSWDSSEVMLGSLDDPSEIQVVAGGDGTSAQHPLWLQTALAWTSDMSGYWNWYHGNQERHTHFAVERDCDIPTWVLDAPPACVVNDDLVATVEIADGAGALTLWQPSTGGITRLLPGTSFIESIASIDEDLYVIAGWARRPQSLVHISPDGLVDEIVGGDPLPGAVAPQARWSEGEAGPVHSWFYAPAEALSPPLLVKTHGGPTSAARADYDREIQFWVSRGFAVLDVNYSGSTGFGRAYRDRLKGRWGLLDVSDVVAAVGEITAAGLADPARVAIMGGSAGGYTTLQSLVTTDVFAAGMSSYGIGDLRTLATDTHKAESRYPDSLVGPWPEAEETYLARSPITQLENLSTPMLILQGMDDKVVPPNQAFDMAEAVRAKGQPLALVTFEGEGHGFRSMAARRTALESKVSFLQQVFGMEHSTDVPRLEIENLPQ
ncbi:S9 family peptidase [Tessaracoccus rhinocerotis]|uniref:S9 family peptidase n=1 Tax=Tessaracoccus rhinocerotis TaxID=1689449 RepID=A0A553K446_9ACTN|nr:prolyl oligopeptidase family serine peptidase [Tessaracoccus rhinocerotis]TRY19471.1 S9 family peptidase [Tessaracoccus rhinocerotis]